MNSKPTYQELEQRCKKLDKKLAQLDQVKESLCQSERELKIRNRIAEIFLTAPDEEMYQEVMKVILDALESKHGTFGYFNWEGTFICKSMSKEVWGKCQVLDKEIIFQKGTWGGLWGQSVEERKALYSNKPFDVPEGHIPIKNTMVVPVIYRDAVISVIHIANREADYDENDRKLLESIANHIAPVLYARLQKAREEKERKRAEKAVGDQRQHLEELITERTVELMKSNESLRQEISEHKQTEEALRNHRNRLRSLASEVSLAEERERRRIAEGLHDHIGQNLYLSRIQLEKLQKSASSIVLASSLDKVMEHIEKIIDKTRSLTFDLSPPVLYELGFESALEWLTEQVYEQHGILYAFEDDEQPKPLDDDVRVLLYQSVRELLANVTKHAQASEVKVSVYRENGNIRIDLKDNGIGFDPTEIFSPVNKNGGFGFFSIRERLDCMGGYLECESRQGQGTRVSLITPLSSNNE